MNNHAHETMTRSQYDLLTSYLLIYSSNLASQYSIYKDICKLKKFCTKSRQTIISPLGGITQSIQHPEQHQVERQRTSIPSSQPNLSAGTRPLILQTISLVVVLGLRTYQTIISMICTGHWLPPYALRLLYGSGMHG